MSLLLLCGNPTPGDTGVANSKKTLKFVACYVRVSTIGQNEAGQRAEIQRWLDGHGLDPQHVHWYVDKEHSGDSLDRPAFEHMQRDVFRGEVGNDRRLQTGPPLPQAT